MGAVTAREQDRWQGGDAASAAGHAAVEGRLDRGHPAHAGKLEEAWLDRHSRQPGDRHRERQELPSPRRVTTAVAHQHDAVRR
jgi:hypothetical protein